MGITITIITCIVIGLIVCAITYASLIFVYKQYIKHKNKPTVTKYNDREVTRLYPYKISGDARFYLACASYAVGASVAIFVGVFGYGQTVTKESYHTVYTNIINADVEIAIDEAKVTLKGGQTSGKTRKDITNIIGENPITYDNRKTDEYGKTTEPTGKLVLKKNKATVDEKIDVVLVRGSKDANKVSRIEYGEASITEKLFGRFTVGHKTKTVARVTMVEDYPDDTQALKNLLNGK